MANTLLLIVALGLVSLWTGRLARSKGRNPWMWGSASFLLGIVPYGVHLFAVVPLIVLMFIKSPQQQTGSIESTSTCSRCRAFSTTSSRFCTSCGWELAKQFSTRADEEQTQAAVLVDTTEEEPIGVPDAPPQVSIEGSADDGGGATREPTQEINQEAKREAGADPGQEPGPVEPRTSAPVYRKPVPVDAPTPAAMTERGVRMFNQGRIQESIDQFTKAIALDANYTEAWAKRAEAYALLGRGEEAAEDRRRLDSLDTRSTGG